jgi:hypothetical protein
LQRRQPEGLLRAAALRSLAKALNETRLTHPLVSRSVRRSVPKEIILWPSPRGDGMATPLPRRAAAAVLLALLTIAGCTDARSDTTPTTTTTPTTAAPSSPTPDPTASAKAEALAAYRGFWTAADDADTHPKRAPSALKTYAIDKALANALATVALYRQQGIVMRGHPGHEPQIVSLRVNADPPSATIHDCVDLTGVKVIYRKTGKSALAPNQSRRHVAIAEATISDGRWVIREVSSDRKQSC